MAVDSGSKSHSGIMAAQADNALALQYAAVSITSTLATKLGAKHQIDVTSAGARPNGFLLETGGADAIVHYDSRVGPQKAVAGAAVASAGVPLVVGTSGKLLPNGTSGDAIVAVSLEPASGDGSVFEVYYNGPVTGAVT
jgi:hypothetical protein